MSRLIGSRGGGCGLPTHSLFLYGLSSCGSDWSDCGSGKPNLYFYSLCYIHVCKFYYFCNVFIHYRYCIFNHCYSGSAGACQLMQRYVSLFSIAYCLLHSVCLQAEH